MSPNGGKFAHIAKNTMHIVAQERGALGGTVNAMVDALTMDGHWKKRLTVKTRWIENSVEKRTCQNRKGV